MLANLVAAHSPMIFQNVLAHAPALEQISAAGARALMLAGQALAGVAFVLRLLPALRTLRYFAASAGVRLAGRSPHC